MKQIFIALDQLINTLFMGMADETISARLFRLYLTEILSSKWYLIVDILFFWQYNHCYNAWRAEIERRQLPSYYNNFGVK